MMRNSRSAARGVALLVVVLCLGGCLCEAKAEPPPAKEITLDLGGGVKMEWVLIPAGEFMMGSPEGEPNHLPDESPVHEVKITKAFYMGETEVTQAQYEAVMGVPFWLRDPNRREPNNPMVGVTGRQGNEFCAKLSKATGKHFRLPTEAEWEYACRAGKPVPDKSKLADYAWFFQEKTQPVGQKKPNAWGLYDTLGNVGEWCVDMCGKPVVCGGSWEDVAKDVTPTARKYQDESWQANDPQSPKSKWWLSDGQFVGFRVVRVK